MKIGVILIAFGLLCSECASAGNPVLLYIGTGATSGDISSLKNRLASANLPYDTATSSQMNSKSLAELESYKLLVWPGGDSTKMAGSLTSGTNGVTARVKQAVEDGLNYIGFCAGSFMGSTSSAYNYLDLASTWFNFYSQNAIEMVSISYPNGTTLPVVYWDGPIPKFGNVVAKYPGTAGAEAIGEGYVGKGWVILSGVHPEANYNWSCNVSSSPCVKNYSSSEATNANAYAETLIKAAYNRTNLPHF